MTHVVLAGLTARQRYWLITGSVGPRPIALVTTCDADGRCNAAPFSAFNYVSEDPPLLMIGVDLYGDESHRQGERKDTLRNIELTGEFVVNMVDEPILEQAVRCGSDMPADISEPEVAGLGLAPSGSVAVPRIAQAPITWECRLHSVVDIVGARVMVLGEILAMSFRDSLLDEARMRVRVDRFSPVGRLGGPNYCRSTDRLSVPVPPYGNLGKPRV